MEKIKEKYWKIKLFMLGVTLIVVMLLNAKVYAANSSLNVIGASTSNTQPLIETFSITWRVTCENVWAVYTPNVGIIKMTASNNGKNGSITIKALNSNQAINSNYKKGLTYIRVYDKVTGLSRIYWIQVLPNANKLEILNKKKKFEKGKIYQLKAKTSRSYYINMSGDEKIRWFSSDNEIAEVNYTSGKLIVKNYGIAKITATYNDGKHPGVSDNFTIKLEDPNKPIGTELGYYSGSNSNVIDVKKFRLTDKDKYSLTENQKKELAYLAFLQEGSINGAKLELSFMANLAKQNDYSNVYYFATRSGWYSTNNIKDVHSNPDSKYKSQEKEYMSIVDEILLQGKRYLPENVNEHDWIGDISSISTGQVNNRADYIPYKTIIYNKYGSKYVFVGFESNEGDIFGTTRLGYYSGKKFNEIDTSRFAMYVPKTYRLTQNQMKELAYLAFLEGGSVDGVKLELSFMANLAKQNNYSSVYNFATKSGWYSTNNIKDVHSEPDSKYKTQEKEYMDLVSEILVKGKRYLPEEVDEHDYLGDIASISTGKVNNRVDYIPYKTIVYNTYGNKYMFVGFAPNGGDAFGCTNY